QNMDRLIKSPSAATDAPFLLWPVARLEYYQWLSLAALMPLFWGFMVFGFRALGIVICFVSASLLAYGGLARLRTFNPRYRFNQNLTCTIVAAGLLCPLVPWYWALVCGIATALLTWAGGLSERHRIHAGLLAPLLLMAVLPLPRQWPLLVVDRLFIGDIDKAQQTPIYNWPTKPPAPNVDAVLLNPPDRALHILLAKIAPDPGSVQAQTDLRDAFALNLPSPVDLIFGGVPGRIGTAALVIIILAGLYLAYRHILLPSAWAIFLAGVLFGLVFGPLGPHPFKDQFWQSLGGLWYLSPDHAVTLLFYELCSTDFIFASVFILALPGTMPLEPHARWVFLAAAGIGAALIYRLDMPFPPATVMLLLLQPAAPLLDTLFHRRSWLLRDRP
ncbi:MAG TPA: RnfABCDGE type electron transport complex subunit D, partial [Phycisphaerae bacterium]|nr:RnfABCDGE type electron transport complex subunit D [Phycisphaerae bacterium]